MSRLRDSAHALSRMGMLPVLSTERLLMTERVSAHLDRRVVRREAAPDLDALARPDDLSAMSDAELRRAVGAVWTMRVPEAVPAVVVAAALGRQRRSCDRAIVEAYLHHHPVDHPACETLRQAAATAAGRHAWRWRQIGEDHRLWDADAAARLVGMAPAQIGLKGRLATGAFARAIRGPG